MKNVRTNEVNLIRSRALTVFFSLILSALILFPFILEAKGKEKAKESESVYIHALQQNAYAAVTISNVSEGLYNLSVESSDGYSVYYNELLSSPEKFSRIFDFSTLQDGTYTFKVENGGEVIERSFTVEDGDIKVKYVKDVVPTFAVKDSKAIISFDNELDNSVNVSVYTARGDELLSKTIDKNSKGKKFDFSKVAAGDYSIVVYTRNKEYAFNYTKE